MNYGERKGKTMKRVLYENSFVFHGKLLARYTYVCVNDY